MRSARALVAGLLLAAAPLRAETVAHGHARAPARTVVRFDDDMIRGDLQRPDGDLVQAPPPDDQGPLSAPPASFARAARNALLGAADRAARTAGR